MKTNIYKKNRNLYYLFKTLGIISIVLFSIGGFLVYNFLNEWSIFTDNWENFKIIEKDTLKLNWVIAFPILMSLLTFLYVMYRKNKAFFKGKMTLNILFLLAFIYFVYSLIGAIVGVLIGLFIGCFFEEFVFGLLAKHYHFIMMEHRGNYQEYEKEVIRHKAKEDINSGKVDLGGV